MKKCILALAVMTASIMTQAVAQELKYPPLPYPKANDADTWVMIEIWPDVGDITLHSYFMDWHPGKNANLCEATKKVFDRDGKAQEKIAGRKFTSYRQCLNLSMAIAKGYVKSEWN